MTLVNESFENFKDLLNEAQSIDIMHAIKDIKVYNNSKKEYVTDLEDLSISIIKNLGYKHKDPNVANVMNHLSASMDDDDNIPEDKDLVKELYKILK